MNTRKVTLLAATALLAVSLTACDSPEEKYAKYIDRGNTLFEKGDYDTARVEYKNAVRLKPADADVRYRLGLVDEAQGNLQEAFKNFVMAEQQDAHHHDALLKLAQYLIAGNQSDEAFKRINILLGDAPNDANALALKASLHLRGKELDLAEQTVRKALENDPANVIGYSVLTGIYVTRGAMDKAGDTVEEGVKRNPKNVGLLLLKAMIYERTSNIDKISEAYKVIFSLKPEDVRYRDDLAKVYVQAEKIDEAEKILRDGVVGAPDNWDMKKKLVAFLNEKRGVDAAEKAIREYMQAYPDNKDLVFWLADLYIANKAMDRAIALLQEVVKKSEDDVKEKHSLTARTSLARIHFAQGDRSLAEKLTQAVLEQDPNNSEALLVRARMLYTEGDYQNAVVALRTIVRDKPDAADALQFLGESLLAQGYMDLAVDTFSQLVQAAPTNLPAKVRLAQLLSANGDSARALALLDLVTKVDPSYSVGWESMARVALDSKNWSLAENAIKTLEDLKDQTALAQFLRGQLAVAKGLPDEAFSFYKQVVATDVKMPLAGHALRALAALYRSQNKREEAVAYFSSLDQTAPNVLSLLGQAQLALGRKAEAAQAFDRAIETRTSESEAYIGRAQLLLQDKKAEEALSLFARAETAIPTDMRLTMMRADIFAAQGLYKDSLAMYEKILAHNPNADAAANNAAQLIADYVSDDPAALEKARILSERFIRSSSPYYLDTLAWVYFRQGKVDQAQTIYERILAAGQKLPEAIYYHHGLLLMKTGRMPEARQAFEKAVRSPVPFAGLEDAKKWLSSAELK